MFYIGDIYQGIDIHRHSILLEKYTKKSAIICENEELCLTCPLKEVCLNDICPSVSWDRFNNLLIKPAIDCKFSIMLFKNCRTMMKVLVEENNLLFKDYLDRIYKHMEDV